MSEYELRVMYDSRKSFYKKAWIIEEEGNKKLKSYQTIVAEIINDRALVYGTYSNTTLRHIKEFLKQNGFKAESSKQILSDYSPSKEETQQKDKQNEDKYNSLFKSIKMLSAISDVMFDNQKETNDFKARILKAGLENRGLIIPEDWNELSEDEKQKRLNNAIGVL